MIKNQFLDKSIRFLWTTSLICFSIASIFSLNDSFIIHNYRQAQTALTTQYFIFNGLHWEFQTPLMGFPWRVPMEFPIYQGLVYLVQQYTDLNLVVCGKLINILCHVFNNFILIGIVRKLGFKTGPLLLGLIFYNFFPFYLVFDNVFLPDTLAVSFVFLSLYFLVNYFTDSSKIINLFLFFIFSTLTGLSKSTTFIGVLGPITVFFWLYRLSNSKNILTSLFERSANSKKLIISAFFLFLAFVVSYVWIQYSDSVKLSNSFSANWISSNPDFRKWNYGSILQRLSIGNWSRYLSYSMLFHPIFIVLNVVLVTLFFVHSKVKERILASALLLFFLFPPLFFFNLFYVHTYYSIANMIFYMLFLGMTIWVLINNYKAIINYVGILLFTILLVFGLYRSWTFRNQILKNGTEPGVYSKLKEIHFTPSYEDVIMVIRSTRDPFIEYFFKCKGINISKEEFHNYVTKENLKNLAGGRPIKMICVVDSAELNELPKSYQVLLPNYIHHAVISNQTESNEYFNFFWNE
jgi:hypothetical protein